MLPSVGLHGLVEPKILNPGDQLRALAQSAKLATRIDVGIDRASVIYFAVVDPRDDESVEVGHVLEVPAGIIFEYQVFNLHVPRARQSPSPTR
jgi:hypothetical protein